MFTYRSKKTTVLKNFQTDVQHGSTDYPHRLNFYTVPPQSEITVEEFELWAIDRLYVLGEIESSLYRNKTQKEMEVTLKPLFDKYMPLNSNTAHAARGGQLEQERRRDHYSHFILRLAFCRSEDLRRRFVRAETMLFRIRYAQDDARERQRFIESLNVDWEMVDENEKTGLADSLKTSTQKPVEAETFFKVDFERVPDLVEKRRVFLRNGKAFLPVSEQQSLIVAEFSTNLEAALEQTARALPRLDEDDRLVPILNHLSLGFTAPEYTTSPSAVGSINAAQIDQLVKHYPLCMRNLHKTLRREKHLRHYGRLQYGLFLKGIGLDVEEAIVFWRTAFATMSDDKFKREHQYNVRHSYGLEGGRRNYKPMSCQQILTGPQPGPGDAHGCPYRHFSVDNLIATLEDDLHIRDARILREVREAVTAKHFHIACTKVFEATHPANGSLVESINHPNHYFETSYGLTDVNAAET